MELLAYLLKMFACMAIFFAFYLLFLRKLTFFKLNRFYLLGTLLLSVIVPALQFSITRQVPVVKDEVVFQAENQEENRMALEMPTPTAVVSPVPVQVAFEWQKLIVPFYVLVALVLLAITIFKLIKLLKNLGKAATVCNGIKLVPKTDGFTNCSFFNYVFIDEKNLTAHELTVILAHERVHVEQYHSADKVLLSFAKAVLWINPMVYLFDKALEEAHEFEADAVASKRLGVKPYADLLLRLAMVKPALPLIHHFVKSPIKERIKMLLNQKSGNMKKLVYVLALPVILALGYGFTVNYVDVITSPNNNQFTLVVDAGHGGANNGARANGLTEKDLTLRVAKEIKNLAKSYAINVVLTRANDVALPLNERVKAKGDFFITLHADATADKNTFWVAKAPNLNYEVVKDYRTADMTWYLHTHFKNLAGVKYNNKPKQLALYTLKNNPSPALAINLGSVKNISDARNLKSKAHITLLAKTILAAFEDYNQHAQTDEELKKVIAGSKASNKYINGVIGNLRKGESFTIFNLQSGKVTYKIHCNKLINEIKEGDNLNVLLGRSAMPPPPKGKNWPAEDANSYIGEIVKDGNGKLLYQFENESTWRKSARYKSLVAEANLIAGKQLTGIIERIHYFGVAKIADGLILKVDEKRYRVYIQPKLMQTLAFRPGDKLEVSTNKIEVWQDSNYPVIMANKTSIKTPLPN